MADEKLRLQAELRDNMSPQLRKIREQINGFRKTPGIDAAVDGMKSLGDQTKKFAEAGGVAAETLGAMGVGGLATAGSLAAVIAQMRELGQRSLAMKEFARETGVGANWLNVWGRAGLNFGVNSDVMQGSLNTLSEKMVEFRVHTGDLYKLISGKWPDVAKKLLGDNPEQQIKDIFALVSKYQNDPQRQKRLLGEFFGNGAEMEKLFRDGATGFWGEFNKQQKQLNPINPDLFKQAQAFRKSLTAFDTSLANFENSTGPAFLRTMTALVSGANSLLHAFDTTPEGVKYRGRNAHYRNSRCECSRHDAKRRKRYLPRRRSQQPLYASGK